MTYQYDAEAYLFILPGMHIMWVYAALMGNLYFGNAVTMSEFLSSLEPNEATSDSAEGSALYRLIPTLTYN